MTASLQTINVDNASTSLAVGGSTPDVVMDLSAILPEVQRKPRIFVQADEKTGLPFYAWDHSTESRSYQNTKSFVAKVAAVKTIVQNADDETKRAVKLVLDLTLDNGMEITMSCGAATYSSLSLISGMSGLDADQLSKSIGISGKTGTKGVVFLSVFSDGKLIRNPDTEELLKEARKDGVQVQAIESMACDINDRITA